MSIAVSAVIKPSRALFVLTVGMSLSVVGIGISIGMGYVGALALPLRLSLATADIFLALLGFYCTVRARKTHPIDISGIGQIRLMEYKTLASIPLQPLLQTQSSHEVTLMANSTLWSFMLILRLKTENQQIVTVPILPDSVGPEEFRALAVACRWIAAHNNPARLSGL